MTRVVVTSGLAVAPEVVRGWFGVDRALEVVWPSGGKMWRAELLRAVGSADGLICLFTDRVYEELLRAAPRLRVVANHAVGLDNVDLAACTRRCVAVTQTPDVLTGATADLTLALILAVARRLGEA